MAGLLKKALDQTQADPQASDPNAQQPPANDQAAANDDGDGDQPGGNAPADGNGDEGSSSSSMPPRQEVDDNEGEPASPEEQQQYEELFKNGWRMIADPKGNIQPAILKMLDTDPSDLQAKLPKDQAAELEQFNPGKALAATIVTIMLALATKAKQAGVQLYPSSMLQAGRDLMSDLAQVAAKQGIHKYSDQELQQAAIFAVGMYGKAAHEQGLISDDEVQQDVTDMRQMDQSGQLAAMMQKEQSAMPQDQGQQQDQSQPAKKGLPKIGGQ